MAPAPRQNLSNALGTGFGALALTLVLGGSAVSAQPTPTPPGAPAHAAAGTAPAGSKEANPLEELAKGLGIPAGVLAILGGGWFLFTRGKPIQENKKAWEDLLQPKSEPEDPPPFPQPPSPLPGAHPQTSVQVNGDGNTTLTGVSAGGNLTVASGAPVIQGDMFAGDKITHIHEAPKPELKPKTKPHNLPFASIGPLFKGRAALMEQLESTTRPVALIGQGGVGKTRLAIEHAWEQVGRCNAVLLISAGSAEALNRNLAGLCAPAALDLREDSTTTEEAAQRQAVLHWLQANPGWLLIVDNVDTSEAAAAIEGLLPQLSGGQVVLTTRLRNWSAAVQGLEVEVLEPEDAREFLLERTAERRRKADDDATTAQAIAVDDLGRLALALEQAGAYISQRRLSLAAYREQWQSKRELVLSWSDAQLMQYDRSLATTWLTSYQQVDPPARTLLRRLAWFSSEPIPESLLEVEVPGDPEAAAGAWEAISQLEAYSLVNRSAEAPTFSLHRLVQEVGRLWQQQSEQPEPNELEAALGWLNGAFVGDPQDVRSWAVLDPLAPHAKAVAGFAEAAGISQPTARVLSVLGLLLKSKAAYAEAEPLLRRALAIDEASYGPDHPEVAMDLNNLAQLLQDTGRLAEAEPLMRRALAIDEASYGTDHPTVARDLNNLAGLLQATNRLAEAEPLLRRALAIDEASYGTDHPRVAIRLNNLAGLLQDTNRLAEAEPLMGRAFRIFWTSLGLDHPNTKTVRANYITLLKAMGLSEAEIQAKLQALQPPT